MNTERKSFRRYSLYGEDNAHLEAEFIHVEPISTRSSRYEWTIAEHSHPGIFQILLLERGEGRFTADGRVEELLPASLVMIPSGSIHAFDFADTAEGWVLSLATPLASQLISGNTFLEHAMASRHRSAVAIQLPPKAARRLSWLLAEIAEDFAGGGGGHLSEPRLAMLRLLLTLASESLMPDTQPTHAPSGTEARREHLVQRFRLMVDQHFREGWAVSRYAGALGTSAPTLTRACQVVLGRPPGDVVLDRLQLEAMRALTYTATSVSRIAEDLGFVDPAYFSRFFKGRLGITPRAFRAERVWLKGAG